MLVRHGASANELAETDGVLWMSFMALLLM
ncbi:Protein of unknown function [Micromonospora lupini str. Lupac 08]|uniref:Uncharacterized protein n=1 Tax=Micromonospora lupini str. Lupac 08 TaxID=1150864 RepID=I0LBI0_9ACTN|nr:Protein of unknown function [Micromonospora lupini str. Lupac 08]